MILTDKCKSSFKEWVEENYFSIYVEEEIQLHCEHMPDVCDYSLITEFFDLQGIYIAPNKYKVDWGFVIRHNDMAITQEDKPDTFMMSRTEALKAAIEKANEFYNTKNQ